MVPEERMFLMPLLKRNSEVQLKAYSNEAGVPLQSALLVVQKYKFTYLERHY